MTCFGSPHRTLAPIGSLTLVFLFSTLFPAIGLAQGNAELFLRPHCVRDIQEDCPAFQTASPTMLKTNSLQEGDVLDVDVIVRNPNSTPLRRVRTWLAYDPLMLEGIELSLGTDLPIATPGEAGFFAADGLVKLETHVEEGTTITDGLVSIARIRFRVKMIDSPQTIISFHGFNETLDSTILVTTQNSGTEESILKSNPGGLMVMFSTSDQTGETVTPPPPPTSTPPPPPPSSPSSNTEPRTENRLPTVVDPVGIAKVGEPRTLSSAFSLLQVQNVRVTSRADMAYLAWDPLLSSELIGYNIYYSTTSGEYIQRRSVDGSATEMSIGPLPQSTRYFFAVRGVGRGNVESAFSQEVAVTIGTPSSSTAPLHGALPGPMPTPSTGGIVSGETGIPQTLLLFLLASAVLGTIIACRRQLIAYPHQTPKKEEDDSLIIVPR